jgi:hypothetical protein
VMKEEYVYLSEVRPFFFSSDMGLMYPPCQWWCMEGRGMCNAEKDHNPKRHLS